MKTTTKKTTAPKAPAKTPAKSQPKCQALNVGHRSCNCGREGCGANITAD